MGKPFRKPKHAAKSGSRNSRLATAVAMALVGMLGGGIIYWASSPAMPTTPVEAVGSQVGIVPGMLAPFFEGTIHTGETLSSSEDLAGHRFLLWFYPRASTGG